MPPHVAAARAWRLGRRWLTGTLNTRRARSRCSYPARDEAGGRLAHRIVVLDPPESLQLNELSGRYRRHEFDLLGSGWVRVAHGHGHAGFGPWRYGPGPALPADWRSALVEQAWPADRPRVRALLDMIEGDYTPIDWHVDFVSGYRWSPRQWGPGVPFAHKPGVDIKLPWELGRLQHLPQLALSYRALGDEAVAREFRNQVLDFLAANPPGWGVQWACAMDVAIRAANLAVARDLFQAGGAAFDEAFEAELAAALLAHGRFIVGHLEWNGGHRGNHYLANICGLAFAAAYLPRSPETDAWLAFATRALDEEIRRQFLADGANFEASTCYHRLSAEMALVTAALLIGLPDDKRKALAEYDHRRWPRAEPALAPAPAPWPPLSDDALERLARAARFAADVMKPSGQAVQIGDNDSGRFFKLDCPVGEDMAERHLDFSGVLAAARGLFPIDFRAPAPADSVTQVTMALAGGILPFSPMIAPARARSAKVVPDAPAKSARRVVVQPADGAALEAMEALCYPEFGLYVWRNARSFIALRCGPVGQDGHGGHAHNDQLAVEIEIDGVPFARDPGSFCYTPDLKQRDRYRSAFAHFVPRHGAVEPARLLAPFQLEDKAKATLLKFDRREMLGVHLGFGPPTFRRVRLDKGCVVIEDSQGAPGIGRQTKVEESVVRSPQELAELWGIGVAFSPGYGLRDF